MTRESRNYQFFSESIWRHLNKKKHLNRFKQQKNNNNNQIAEKLFKNSLKRYFSKYRHKIYLSGKYLPLLIIHLTRVWFQRIWPFFFKLRFFSIQFCIVSSIYHCYILTIDVCMYVNFCLDIEIRIYLLCKLTLQYKKCFFQNQHGFE